MIISMKRLKTILSLLLVMAIMMPLLPSHVFAEEHDVLKTSTGDEPIVLIGGGDYQQAGDHKNSANNVTDILKQITAAGLTAVDGFLFIGDYDCETHDSTSETAAGIKSLMNTVSSVYPNLNDDNTILVQGNHDALDSRIDATGGHEFVGYSVFVMNEDDYPNYGGSESQAKALAEKMDQFLAKKLAEGYTAPIFITSHVPLHFGPRTNKQGDGKYASYVFEVLNAYGAKGLNIIFLHGHNHAYGYDEYLGGEAIYLEKGDSINIAKTGSQSSYKTYTLNFTYMNAGYTGYYNESGYSTSAGTDFLTMTTFEIYEDRVVVGRYNADGIYNLKTAGEKKGDYISSVSVSANTDVYASTQTIVLSAPAERITLADTATGITVAGTKVKETFDDNSDLSVTVPETVDLFENAAKCADYKAYTMNFTCSDAVSVLMPVPASYRAATTKVFYVDGDSLVDMKATISSDSGELTAAFATTHGGTYVLVNEIANNAAIYYERVEKVEDLVSGEQYLIIFDCSSQTTEDAFVIPQIATYSSGSALRKGPDVVISDGIGDKATITGAYDAYLWVLTKSGNGWLIGNGSQNINVAYNSTSGRCELDFTNSGETLTIAAVKGSSSDADSWSYAISDSSNYYWQYNTTATLIYGNTSDNYSSRFCFYKRIDNSDGDSGAANGWVTLRSGGTYTLDTDGVDAGEDNKYIIVDNNTSNALTLVNGTVGNSKVTIDGSMVAVDDPAIYEFYFANNSSRESGTYLLTQDGTNSVYHANGNLYYGSDNKGYWYVKSGSKGSYQIYDYDNMNWYLNYGYVWSNENVSRFAVSSNTRNLQLYKSSGACYAGTYARLAGQTMQTYSILEDVTVPDVLENAFIQVTTDGYHITSTLKVTSDMVSWDRSFNGAIAGTYTGTVTYGGVALGTITVTVTNEHNYDAVIVGPTCTEGGYTIHTCTICGDSYTDSYTAALGHDYEVKTVEATCTTDGSVTYTCACGDTYTETIPAAGHAYETVTVEATCTTDGSVTTTCSVCGDTNVEVIPALGHDYKAVVTDPTCTESGYTTYTCACGDTYVADEVAALGHSYESVTVNATCAKDGYTTYTCTCGETYTVIIPATGEHVYVAETVEATCTENGFVAYTCDCGDTYTEVIPATGHDYEAIVTDPTCTENGCTTYTCGNCGDSYIADEIAALGHDYEAVVTAPTCTEGGYTTYTCDCGHSYVANRVDALGHDYEIVTVEATCETDGSVTTTCAVCGDAAVEVISALGHNYETVTVEATCTEEGSVVRTCVNCGDSDTQIIPALGHDYKTVTVEATCESDGSVTTVCGNCGDTTVEVLPALGHNYKAVVTAPTCTEAGYTTYTCGNCGDTYTADEVAALGHDYKAVVTAPTCTEGGYTTYTCACGDTYVADEVAALGHRYTTEEVDGYLVYTCVCGDTYSESVGWIKLPGSYVLDTDGIEIGAEHKYIIVGADKDYALTLSGNTIGAAKVTVNGNTITLENASGYEFYFANNSGKESGSYLLTQDGTKGVYHMGGNMYYGTDNKGYWHIGSSSKGSYQLYDNDNSKWYLNYGYVWGSDSVSRFAVSSSARYVRLFKAVDSYVRLSGETNQTWAHGAATTESAVLEKVLIQTSTDGSNVSGTAAVTASMITWDKGFDGYTAGTYTATVTYNGESIGTITVTVTGEHNYKTVVVAPTCTEGGYTTHTCDACGLSYRSDVTAALGHSYSTEEVDGYLVYTCGHCGDSYSEKLTADLSYNKVTKFANGDSYVITVYSNRKYYALSHEGNKISVVQVTVSNNEITSEITEDLLWTYNNKKLSYVDGSKTYYLYTSTSGGWFGWGGSTTLSVSTSNSSTVSFSSSKLKVGSYYLRYSSGTIKLDSSSTTTYLFVETEE